MEKFLGLGSEKKTIDKLFKIIYRLRSPEIVTGTMNLDGHSTNDKYRN